MVSPISSLANMEYMLYGGASGLSADTPSYLNGYMANSGWNNNTYYNPWMYNNYYNNPQNQSVFTPQSNTVTSSQGTTDQADKDLATLGKYYADSLSPSESLTSAVVVGGVMGSAMMHPRLIAHPWNSIATLKEVNSMFKGVRVDGSDMNKLWKENNAVMRDAYFRMHKAAARSKSKLGLFRKRYTKEEYAQLKKIMQDALDSKDINKIAEASAKLEQAYVSNGHISGWWKKIRGKEVPTVASGLANKEAIKKGAERLLSDGKMTFSKALKKGGGVKGGILFAALEVLMGLGKIQTAFAKDDETGWKQVGQTTLKAAGNAVGWAVGEAAGVWAATAMGAKIGTLFGPGVGTVVGGVLGFVGGSLGMWLAGKATKKIVGQDVADTITVQDMKKTPEGQAQLLALTAQQAQNDKNLSPEVYQALQNVALRMGA